jgi:hypothetical protein
MSLLTNYYSSNKGYAKVVYFFGGRTLLQLEGYFEVLGFPKPFYNGGAAGPQEIRDQQNNVINDFTNYRVGGAFFAEHRLSDIFGLNLTVNYDEMISDQAIPAGGAAPAAPGNPNANFYDLAWRRFQAFAGARLFW